MKQKDENANNRTVILLFAIIFLLSVVVFLLLLKKPYSYTGGYDVININCEDSERCAVDVPNSGGDGYYSGQTGKSGGGSSQKAEETGETEETMNEPDEVLGEDSVQVKDKGGVWASNAALNIFSNPAYGYENKIAPTHSSAYTFIVNNNTIYDIAYNISFIEDNQKQINMKYRLKDNSGYLHGDDSTWVSSDTLDLSDRMLSRGQNSKYTLEWMWQESPNDTSIGADISSHYRLNVKVFAEQR